MNLSFLFVSIMVKMTMPYRSTQQILVDVLTVTTEQGHVPITSLCRKSNLSHKRLKGFLHNLTSSGLMNEIEWDGQNTFVITDKGRLYLEEYKRFSEIAGSFGLEL